MNNSMTRRHPPCPECNGTLVVPVVEYRRAENPRGGDPEYVRVETVATQLCPTLLGGTLIGHYGETIKKSQLEVLARAVLEHVDHVFVDPKRQRAGLHFSAATTFSVRALNDLGAALGTDRINVHYCAAALASPKGAR